MDLFLFITAVLLLLVTVSKGTLLVLIRLFLSDRRRTDLSVILVESYTLKQGLVVLLVGSYFLNVSGAAGNFPGVAIVYRLALFVYALMTTTVAFVRLVSWFYSRVRILKKENDGKQDGLSSSLPENIEGGIPTTIVGVARFDGEK
jgi:hypothetical protein